MNTNNIGQESSRAERHEENQTIVSEVGHISSSSSEFIENPDTGTALISTLRVKLRCMTRTLEIETSSKNYVSRDIIKDYTYKSGAEYRMFTVKSNMDNNEHHTTLEDISYTNAQKMIAYLGLCFDEHESHTPTQKGLSSQENDYLEFKDFFYE